MPTKKQLEEQIEQLKEENEFLKVKVEELEDFGCPDGELVFFDMYDKIEEWGIMEDSTPKFMEMWNIVKKHYEKLNKDLNKSALIMIECQRFMKEEEEKNKILKEENEKLEEESEKLAAERNKLEEENEKLEEESEKLAAERNKLEEENEKLEEESEKLAAERNKLEEKIENLKKHYETDLMEWKGKHQSLQDMLDLYIEASK
jgi:cell division protein FtsB